MNGAVNPTRLKTAATFAALAALLALSCCIRPEVTPGQDAAQYLAAMRQFRSQGLNCSYPLEPLYPAFLALLETLGLTPEKHAPLVQNALFLGGLYLFLRSLLGRTQRRTQTLQLALAIAAIPTFLVVMNGALYAESLTATLVLVLLSSFVRLMALCAGNAKLLPAAAGWQLAGFGAALLLGLLKGSFVFIHYAFCVLGLAWLWLRPRRTETAHAAEAGASRRRAAWALGGLWFMLVALGSACGPPAWLGIQGLGKTGKLASQYERAGTILYGRTEYARHFDFRTQSVPYLLNALSESACRRLYGDAAARYNFLTENEIGYQKRLREGVPDEQLFQAGLGNLREQPVRQSVFALFELSRFILHHGTTGFAVLELPLLGAAIHSTPASVLLKLFNAALWAAVPLYLLRRRSGGAARRAAWLNMPAEARWGTTCYLLYAAAYFAVYGFGTTVVRMAYPIAPLLIILNWTLLVVAARARARADDSGLKAGAVRPPDPPG